MEEKLTTPRLFSKLPTYDTGEWRAAVVYAQAVAGAALSAEQLDTVHAEFDSLVHDVLERLPKLEAVLSSSFVDKEVKKEMIDKALSKQASPVLLNFLKVLADHDRLGMLRLVHLAFQQEHERLQNKVRVMVSTAEPLTPEAEKRIEQEIQNRLHLQPVLDKRVLPELIGGIVLRVGDRVFDGSIATQLAQLRQKMIDRSVHEIQSRRDRFSSPSGN